MAGVRQQAVRDIDGGAGPAEQLATEIETRPGPMQAFEQVVDVLRRRLPLVVQVGKRKFAKVALRPAA